MTLFIGMAYNNYGGLLGFHNRKISDHTPTTADVCPHTSLAHIYPSMMSHLKVLSMSPEYTAPVDKAPIPPNMTSKLSFTGEHLIHGMESIIIMFIINFVNQVLLLSV